VKERYQTDADVEPDLVASIRFRWARTTGQPSC
jgi:hypothetical protein